MWAHVKNEPHTNPIHWRKALVVYYSQNVSQKSGWEENGTRLFGSVPAGNFQKQRNIWICTVIILSSARNVPNENSYSISSKPSTIPEFEVFAPFFGTGRNWFVSMVNAIPGKKNYRSWIFGLLTIFPSGEPTSFTTSVNTIVNKNLCVQFRTIRQIVSFLWEPQIVQG